MTALRAKKMQELTENAERHNFQKASLINSQISYIDSKEAGSAWKLLNQIKAAGHGSDESTLAYEVQKVNHHALFILLSLLCLILSFVFSEFNLSSLKKYRNTLSTAIIFASLFTFSSCSSEARDSTK